LATNKGTGEVNEGAAAYYAQQLKGVGRLRQQQLEAVLAKSPDLEPREAIKRSKREMVVNLRAVIGDRLHHAFVEFMETEGLDIQDAFLVILEDRLTEEGYY
jgi:hypothetical protein